MRSAEWKTYRTRFLVKEKQLTSTLSFTDHLGRQHCGRKGDYLVESSDGVLSIASRQIFEDIYVPMSTKEDSSAEPLPRQVELDPNEGHRLLKGIRIEPLQVETISSEKFPRRRRTDHDETLRGRRRSPQPVRSARTTPHLSLM